MKHSKENFYKFGLSLSIIVGATILFQISVIGIAENSFALSTVTSLVDVQGNVPSGIEYDPENQRMYVTNFVSNTVSVIDTNTNTVTGNPIKVGMSPKGIEYDPENQRMYVTNFGSNTVSVIDTNTNTVSSTIPVGSGPTEISFDRVNHRMYTANLDNDSLSVIDTNTNTVLGNPIKIGISPKGIAYDPVNEKVYVTNFGAAGRIYAVDTNSNALVGNPIEIGSIPQNILYDSTNHKIYVTDFGSNTVSVIDTNKTNPESGLLYVDAPYGLAHDYVKQRIYVSSASDGLIYVIDAKTNTVLDDPIFVEGIPQEIAYDPFNERLYVAIDNSSSISVLELISLNTTITSAVNDLGYGIKNGTISNSNKISISFNETDAPPHKVQGYECSLDSSKFIPCTSPHSYDNLGQGSGHIFQVRSVDVYGNIGQSPATLVWQVNKTSEQAVDMLEVTCKGQDSRNAIIYGLDKDTNSALENLLENDAGKLHCPIAEVQSNNEANWDQQFSNVLEKNHDNNAGGSNHELSAETVKGGIFNCGPIDRMSKSNSIFTNEEGYCGFEADRAEDQEAPQITLPQFKERANNTTQNVPLALPF